VVADFRYCESPAGRHIRYVLMTIDVTVFEILNLNFGTSTVSKESITAGLDTGGI